MHYLSVTLKNISANFMALIANLDTLVYLRPLPASDPLTFCG